MSIDIGPNCGTQIRATATFTVISCPSYSMNTGMVTIVQNSIATANATLQIVQSLIGSQPGAYYGSQLDTLQFNNDLQVFVFFTAINTLQVQVI